MKQKLPIVIIAALLFSLACAFSASASSQLSQSAESTAPILTYRGLSARTSDDFAGLRAMFEVNRKAVQQEVSQGNRVVYGVIAAEAGEKLPTLSVRDAALSPSDGAKATVIYDSENLLSPTNLYYDIEGEYARFAYTVAYFHEQQYDKYLTKKLVFRGFYQINGKDVCYVDMSADFASGASLFDVSQALVKEEAYANCAALHRIIRKASYNGVLRSEYTHSKQLGSGSLLTLSSMEAGIYCVSALGEFGKKDAVSLYVEETRESYGCVFAQSCKTASFSDSASSLFYCILQEGENNLRFMTDAVFVQQFKLERVRSIPEGSIHISLAQAMTSSGYAKVTCASVSCDCNGYHYAEATNKWLTKWSNTPYLTSDSLLPDNILIRDFTDLDGIDSNKTEASLSGEAAYAGTGIINKLDGKDTSLVMNADTQLRLGIQAEKAGTYRVLLVLGAKALSASYDASEPRFSIGLSVGNGDMTYTEMASGENIFRLQSDSRLLSGDITEVSQAPVSVGYAIAGSVTLQEGKNTVTLAYQGKSPTDRNEDITLPAVILVPIDSHQIDLAYTDEKGEEHILSRQIVKDGEYAVLPTHPLPHGLAEVALADGESLGPVKEDKKLRLTVVWQTEAE